MPQGRVSSTNFRPPNCPLAHRRCSASCLTNCACRLLLPWPLQALALKPGDCTGKELKLKPGKFQAVNHLYIFVKNEEGDKAALTRMTFIGAPPRASRVRMASVECRLRCGRDCSSLPCWCCCVCRGHVQARPSRPRTCVTSRRAAEANHPGPAAATTLLHPSPQPAGLRPYARAVLAGWGAGAG